MSDTGKKIGRPKKAPDEQRSTWFPRLRATPAELSYVEDMANRAGVSLPEFCRRAIMGQRIHSRRADVNERTLAELNRIGVNLNQIAHRLNARAGVAADLPTVLFELQEALAKVLANGSERR